MQTEWETVLTPSGTVRCLPPTCLCDYLGSLLGSQSTGRLIYSFFVWFSFLLSILSFSIYRRYIVSCLSSLSLWEIYCLLSFLSFSLYGRYIVSCLSSLSVSIGDILSLVYPLFLSLGDILSLAYPLFLSL